MPSTSLQAKISAFESLVGGSSPRAVLNTHTSPSRENTYNSRGLPTEKLLSTSTAAALPPIVGFSSTPTKKQVSPSPSPPNLGRRTSLIDLKDWIVDDGRTVPHRNSFKPEVTLNGNRSNRHIDYAKTPTQQGFTPKRFSNHSTTPLINLDSPPRPTLKSKPANLHVNPTPKPPPLPPRKSSYTSLKSVASTSSSQSTPATTSNFLYPPRRLDSPAVDQVHSYPPHPNLSIDSRSRHAAGSSISSFHSVSLSSDTDPSTPGSVTDFIDTYPMDQDHDSLPTTKSNDPDSLSLTESYEDVSTSSLASPATERMITLDFEKARAKRKPVPPKLPQRPPSSSSQPSVRSPPPPRPRPFSGSSSRSTPGSPIINPTTPIPMPYAVRRTAPPPPSRSSDRSSIQSTSTSFSVSSSTQSHQSRSTLNNSPGNQKAKRPTPVPLAAQRRYEAVFNGNVIQRRRAEKQRTEEKPNLLSPSEVRGRRAAGWRGLSVDLITGDSDTVVDQLEKSKRDGSGVDEMVGKDEKLEGTIIKLIWNQSGLDKQCLAEIWNECDPAHTGSLKIEAFVKGMWKIDEQLRRAQALALKSASSVSLVSIGSRHAPGLSSTRVRNILR